MPLEIDRIELMCQTLAMVRTSLDQLELRVEQLEHYSNQQTILVDTLGDIMEELKRQER